MHSPTQPAKTTLFAGGNEADVRKMAGQSARRRSRQKPRFLPAATKPMSEKWPQAIFPNEQAEIKHALRNNSRRHRPVAALQRHPHPE
jgi:hypothetical protein